MLPTILMTIYIIGIIVWMKIEKKCFPYEEGDYTIEFDDAHEITPEMHNSDAVCRSIFWPFCLTFIVLLLPIVLLIKIFENL